MRKIVVASDSYKGSLSAFEVCNQIEKGIRRVLPEVEVIKMPMADGGEGTVDAVLDAVPGRRVRINVNDPHYRLINASYAILEDNTAVIEMAAASGLTLVEDRMDPMTATTYGTGQLIKDALDRGCRDFIIGIGGSATNDGGIGMAAALGARFLGSDDIPVSLCGKGLGQLDRIDLSKLDPRIQESRFTVACDVDNPLFGEQGAAYIYGPQKGADETQIKCLDDNLKRFAEIVLRDVGIDISTLPGAGAAGGLGGGLIAFVGAKLSSGTEILMDIYRFDERIQDVDLIFTGEGRIDSQSLRGKVIGGIAGKAKERGIPLIAMVGAIGDGVDPIFDQGVTAVFSINTQAMDYSESRKHTAGNVKTTAEMIMRLIRSMRQTGGTL